MRFAGTGKLSALEFTVQDDPEAVRVVVVDGTNPIKFKVTAPFAVHVAVIFPVFLPPASAIVAAPCPDVVPDWTVTDVVVHAKSKVLHPMQVIAPKN